MNKETLIGLSVGTALAISGGLAEADTTNIDAEARNAMNLKNVPAGNISYEEREGLRDEDDEQIILQVDVAENPEQEIFPTETPRAIENEDGEETKVLVQTTYPFEDSMNEDIDRLVEENGEATLSIEQLREVYDQAGVTQFPDGSSVADTINLLYALDRKIENDQTLGGTWSSDNPNKSETRANLVNIDGQRSWTIENRVLIDGVIGPNGVEVPVNSQAILYNDADGVSQLFFVTDPDGEGSQTIIDASGQLLTDGSVVVVTTKYEQNPDGSYRRQAILAVDNEGDPFMYDDPDGEDETRFVDINPDGEESTSSLEPDTNNPEIAFEIERAYFQGEPIPYGNLTSPDTSYGGNYAAMSELIDNIIYNSGYLLEETPGNISLLSAVIISEPYLKDGVYYYDVGFPDESGTNFIAKGSAFLGENGNSRITQLPETYNYDPYSTEVSGHERLNGLVGKQVIIQTYVYDFTQDIPDQARFQLFINSQQAFLDQGGLDWLENSLETEQYSEGLLGATTEVFFDRN